MKGTGGQETACGGEGGKEANQLRKKGEPYIAKKGVVHFSLVLNDEQNKIPNSD